MTSSTTFCITVVNYYSGIPALILYQRMKSCTTKVFDFNTAVKEYCSLLISSECSAANVWWCHHVSLPVSRPHCHSCWTTSVWWLRSAPSTEWLSRIWPSALDLCCSRPRRRRGSVVWAGSGEEEEGLKASLITRRWRVQWILNDTSRRCTTCCSSGPVRQAGVKPPPQ